MTTTHRRLQIVAGFVALLAAVGIGYWFGRSRESASTTASPNMQPADRQVIYWYDPMVPDQHFDKPGKSPFMDMPMVPKYADEATSGHFHCTRRAPEPRHAHGGGQARTIGRDA